jgi:hypothetical protein
VTTNLPPLPWGEAKAADLVEIAERLGVKLRRVGPHFFGACPAGCARQDGFVIHRKKGFLCRPSGAKGDSIDMVEHALSCSKVEALEFVIGRKVGVGAQDGQQPPAPPPVRPAREEPENKSNATTTAQALTLWEQGVDPRASLVERYLNDERGLDLGIDLAGDVLRWHQGVGAMLALFRNILTGEPQAISRTFIDPRTLKRTHRSFLGPSGGAAVMLDPFEDVLEGLHIGEGIETCMAARELGLRPTWALGSSSVIPNFPIIPNVEILTLLQENDERGASQRACEACARRWYDAGREAIILTPNHGSDLNDVLKIGRSS